MVCMKLAMLSSCSSQGIQMIMVHFKNWLDIPNYIIQIEKNVLKKKDVCLASKMYLALKIAPMRSILTL